MIKTKKGVAFCIFLLITSSLILGCIEESDVTTKYIPFEKASGSEVCLINYNNATDPTWDELIIFLQNDNTDEIPYNEDSFICGDYAERVHNNAEKSGIKSGWVYVSWWPISETWIEEYGYIPLTKRIKDGKIVEEGHAINVFNTTDKGLVFVDCTGSISVKNPSTDNWRNYEYDAIAYVEEGREYGLISINKAVSNNYSFYNESINKWKDFGRKKEEYENDLAFYNRMLKITIYPPIPICFSDEDCERVNKQIDSYNEWIDNMNARFDDLEEMYKQLEIDQKELEEEVGFYWIPLYEVSNFEIYW